MDVRVAFLDKARLNEIFKVAYAFSSAVLLFWSNFVPYVPPFFNLGEGSVFFPLEEKNCNLFTLYVLMLDNHSSDEEDEREYRLGNEELCLEGYQV